MKLDNEDQRKLLLQIVSSTNIQGTFQQVKEATKTVGKLIDDIEKAEVHVETIGDGMAHENIIG